METLLIDDNSTSVFLTEMLMKREGFSENVRSFLSAKEALAYLQESLPERVPDVIFLDLNMPVMDGWDFLEALRPHEAALAARSRIYILTSSLAISDDTRAKEYSLVAGLIHKPIDGHILHIIREAVGEKE